MFYKLQMAYIIQVDVWCRIRNREDWKKTWKWVKIMGLMQYVVFKVEISKMKIAAFSCTNSEAVLAFVNKSGPPFFKYKVI